VSSMPVIILCYGYLTFTICLDLKNTQLTVTPPMTEWSLVTRGLSSISAPSMKSTLMKAFRFKDLIVLFSPRVRVEPL